MQWAVSGPPCCNHWSNKSLLTASTENNQYQIGMSTQVHHSNETLSQQHDCTGSDRWGLLQPIQHLHMHELRLCTCANDIQLVLHAGPLPRSEWSLLWDTHQLTLRRMGLWPRPASSLNKDCGKTHSRCPVCTCLCSYGAHGKPHTDRFAVASKPLVQQLVLGKLWGWSKQHQAWLCLRLTSLDLFVL